MEHNLKFKIYIFTKKNVLGFFNFHLLAFNFKKKRALLPNDLFLDQITLNRPIFM